MKNVLLALMLMLISDVSYAQGFGIISRACNCGLNPTKAELNTFNPFGTPTDDKPSVSRKGYDLTSSTFWSWKRFTANTGEWVLDNTEESPLNNLPFDPLNPITGFHTGKGSQIDYEFIGSVVSIQQSGGGVNNSGYTRYIVEAKDNANNNEGILKTDNNSNSLSFWTENTAGQTGKKVTLIKGDGINFNITNVSNNELEVKINAIDPVPIGSILNFDADVAVDIQTTLSNNTVYYNNGIYMIKGASKFCVSAFYQSTVNGLGSMKATVTDSNGLSITQTGFQINALCINENVEGGIKIEILNNLSSAKGLKVYVWQLK